MPFETVYGIFEKLVERCNKKTRKVGGKKRSAPEGEESYAYITLTLTPPAGYE